MPFSLNYFPTTSITISSPEEERGHIIWLKRWTSSLSSQSKSPRLPGSIVTGCQASAKVGGAMFEDKLARERPLAAAGSRDFALENWSRVWVRAGTDRAAGPAWLRQPSDSFLKFLLVAAGGGRPRGGINMRGRAWPLRPQAWLRWGLEAGCSRSGRASTASVSLAAIRWQKRGCWARRGRRSSILLPASVGRSRPAGQQWTSLSVGRLKPKNFPTPSMWPKFCETWDTKFSCWKITFLSAHRLESYKVWGTVEKFEKIVTQFNFLESWKLIPSLKTKLSGVSRVQVTYKSTC